MPVTINGDGSITGLSVGGLPDGCVDADSLASNAVTTAKIASNAITSTLMPAGSIIQVVQRTTSGTYNYANVNFQNTEIYIDVTPFHASSKFIIEVMCQFGVTNHDVAISCNFSDSLHASGATHPIAPMTGDGNNGSSGDRMDGFFGFGSFAADNAVDNYYIGNMTGRYLYTPAYQNTNQRRFSMMVRSSFGYNVRLNMNGQFNSTDPRDFRPESSITIYEVKG